MALLARGYGKVVRGGGADFLFYWHAGREVLAGHHPYAVEGYYYPPFFAVGMASLAWLPWKVAAAVWLGGVGAWVGGGGALGNRNLGLKR
ncbi:MAG: glycosyltransferase 87 family protein [Planctomycetota bacterium]